VRAGSSGPLPIGVQVVAGPWQDQVALAVAALIERELGGWQPPPQPDRLQPFHNPGTDPAVQ
jgi:amidase